MSETTMQFFCKAKFADGRVSKTRVATREDAFAWCGQMLEHGARSVSIRPENA